jgi:hypothetical protein
MQHPPRGIISALAKPRCSPRLSIASRAAQVPVVAAGWEQSASRSVITPIESTPVYFDADGIVPKLVPQVSSPCRPCRDVPSHLMATKQFRIDENIIQMRRSISDGSLCCQR